jgi:GWxTD domain-containing protein
MSCFSTKDITTLNVANVYRVQEQTFHPEFLPFIETDSTVRLFIKVLPDEFLFVRQSDEKFKSFITIRADIIDSYEYTKILDSASAEFSFDLADKDYFRMLSLNIPMPDSGLFLIHCFISDKNKGTNEDYFIRLDHLSKPSRQDFLVTDKKNFPLFRTYLYPGDTVKIFYKDSTINTFTCKYYHRDFELAAPPFSFDMRQEFNYTPDSIFTIKSGDLAEYNFDKEGFYLVQTDTSVKTGLTLFRFSGGFPDVTTPTQMLEALRYLTNKKEYEDMKAGTSIKTQVDNFWLTHGGNEEKTRGLIRKYYGRVRDANKFFTSHTEGWRTDRGMIYIIFGSPGTVYRSTESESWTYGTPNSSLALNFFFIKVNNPFTENDFTLSRSPSYESNWFRAVEIWRQGRAYNSFY